MMQEVLRAAVADGRHFFGGILPVRGNMGSSINSFFRFVFGFSLFIAVSLGITVAVTTYSMKKDRDAQTAAAFEAMVNPQGEAAWWEIWK
jgi:hypothetical protein